MVVFDDPLRGTLEGRHVTGRRTREELPGVADWYHKVSR